MAAPDTAATNNHLRYPHDDDGQHLTIVSLRPKLVECVEPQTTSSTRSPVRVHLPGPAFPFRKNGALLRGTVYNIDHTYGAHIRFLNGMTGRVRKEQYQAGGTTRPLLQLLSTVDLRVTQVIPRSTAVVAAPHHHQQNNTASIPPLIELEVVAEQSPAVAKSDETPTVVSWGAGRYCKNHAEEDTPDVCSQTMEARRLAETETINQKLQKQVEQQQTTIRALVAKLDSLEVQKKKTSAVNKENSIRGKTKENTLRSINNTLNEQLIQTVYC